METSPGVFASCPVIDLNNKPTFKEGECLKQGACCLYNAQCGLGCCNYATSMCTDHTKEGCTLYNSAAIDSFGVESDICNDHTSDTDYLIFYGAFPILVLVAMVATTVILCI